MKCASEFMVSKRLSHKQIKKLNNIKWKLTFQLFISPTSQNFKIVIFLAILENMI